jgi:hypothetical protein
MGAISARLGLRFRSGDPDQTRFQIVAFHSATAQQPIEKNFSPALSFRES